MNAFQISTTSESRWQTRPMGKATRKAAPTLLMTGGTDQIWQGFGGCFNELGAIALVNTSTKIAKQVMTALFDPKDGCRFTHCRLPIGASDYAAEWYSLNETAGDFAMRNFSVARDQSCLIPYVKSALAVNPNLTFFASPWSPPTWMKFPRAYNYGTLIWEKKYLEAYALYFVKFVQAYQKEGINVTQIHPQNEPVADQKFPSCLWTGEQLGTFIRDYLAPAFTKAKLDTEFWLGTLNTDDYAAFPLTVLGDETLRRHVAGVAFQWAGKGAIQRTHRAFPAVSLMQSENECGDGANTWAYARYVFDLLVHYLSNGANSYVYWNMVLPEGGRSTWGWRQNSMFTVDADGNATAQPEFYAMKHFSRYIAPGAVRLELSGTWAGNAVAFRNPDDTTVIAVSNPLDKPGALTLENGATARLDPLSFNTLVV
ncbi:MAG: glycosyl hydrolase [Kiritimatiellaeota bacterium]|nr:glycosyl hydrolase [Kiritimatiellota bacterium]